MAHPDFEEFIASFNARRVRYLIIGAHAVALHARPRAFRLAWRSRVDENFGSVPAHFICRADLIAAKIAAGRPQDKVDLLALRKAERRAPNTSARAKPKS